MALRTIAFPFAAAAALILAAGGADAASEPTGIWMNDTGRGAVEIKPCGGGLCGHVVWVKDGSDAKGCGKKIIDSAKPVGANTWDNGRIYSPERGKWYDVELKPLSNGKLRVTGYAGVRFLSKTMIWSKAPADLVRCDGLKIAAPSASSSPAQPAKSGAAALAANPTKPAIAAAASPVKAAPAQPPRPAAEAEPEPSAPDVVAEADDESFALSDKVDLEKGINIGDVVSINKTEDGKCRVKAPFVNLTIKCPN
jgi:uncharacterized protein (DUF2147 family)